MILLTIEYHLQPLHAPLQQAQPNRCNTLDGKHNNLSNLKDNLSRRKSTLGCLLQKSFKFNFVINLIISVECLNVSATNCNLQNFVYHHWGCTSIYQPLSYPFRSLVWCEA